MPKHIAIALGTQFGRLTVTSVERTSPRGKVRVNYRCRCSCGRTSSVQGTDLRRGNTRSCGCLKREVIAAGCARTHGQSGTPEAHAWHAMHRMCTVPTAANFPYYGGRSIRVCGRWGELENFLADVGPCPGDGYFLGRIDKNGHYEPGNCRWETGRQRNTGRRGAHWLTFRDDFQPVVDWSDQTGINYWTVLARKKRGWSPARILDARGTSAAHRAC